MNHAAEPAMPCRGCGGELYLRVTMPHPTMPGVRIVGLCPRCDAHDPAAQNLLAWFAIHGSADDDGTFAQLMGFALQWAQHKQAQPGISDQQIEQDIAAWRRGDYD